MERSKDWYNQSVKDLSAAKDSFRTEHYEWACFQSQQSAEKAMKSLLLSKNIEAWGHSLVYLYNRWKEYLHDRDIIITEDLLEIMQELDRHYIQPRYPNGFSEGHPAEYYNKNKAQECIDHAEEIIRYVEEHL